MWFWMFCCGPSWWLQWIGGDLQRLPWQKGLQRGGPGADAGHGGTPVAGWFLLGKILLKWMITRGTPILGNHHINKQIYIYRLVSWDDYSHQMEKYIMFQTTNQYMIYGGVLKHSAFSQFSHPFLDGIFPNKNGLAAPPFMETPGYTSIHRQEIYWFILHYDFLESKTI